MKNFFDKRYKDLLFIFNLLKKISQDSVFLNSKVKEPLRSFFKIFWVYFTVKLSKFDFVNNKFFHSFYFFLCKYIYIFIFIVWLIIETIFLRFYFVDTPLDAKLYQERKESHKRRFIPIIGFEALSFYVRPFYKVFNTFILVVSNFAVIFWLIYFVYILDILKLIRFFFLLLVNLFIYFFSSIKVFFSFIFLFFEKFSVIFLLLINRLNYRLSKLFIFFNYIFKLPFIFLFHFLRLLFNIFPKFFLIRKYFFNKKEIVYLFEKHKYIFHDLSLLKFYLSLFRVVKFFHGKYIYLFYFNKNFQEDYLKFMNFSNKISYYFEIFKNSFFFKFLSCFYFIFCYFILFYFIFCLFLSYIYLPFFF